MLGGGKEKQERAGRLERRPISQSRCEVIMWGQWEQGGRNKSERHLLENMLGLMAGLIGSFRLGRPRNK